MRLNANRLANVLASLGVGPAQKVIWCGPNSPQVVAVMAATRKIDAVAVPLNYRLTAEEAQYIVDCILMPRRRMWTRNMRKLFVPPDGGQLGNLRQVLVYGGPAA